VSEWRQVRLKHLAAEPIRNGVGEAAQYDDPTWPRYIRTTDIAGPRTLHSGTFASLPEEVAMRSSVRRGDILMSAAGTVGRTLLYQSDEPACFAGYLVRLRSVPAVDSRFVAYWTETPSFIDQVQIGKVTSTIDNFSAGKYRELVLRIPDFAQQEAIADFLDAETTHIDALITKKRRLCSALDEWEQAALLKTAGDWRHVPTVSLRQMGTSVVTGPFGTQLAAAEYVSDGIPVVNPVHIRQGRIVPEQGVTVTEVTARRLSRHRLRPGDLVLGRKGDVGRAALVEVHQSGWICGSDSIAVRPQLDLLSAEFLVGVLRIGYFRQQLVAESTGAMVASVNESALLSFRLPAVPIAAQNEAVRRTHQIHRRREVVVRSLTRQITLLQERRQALITAAVTGELDIAGAA
jgi:type I restriction enzyme S subunit